MFLLDTNVVSELRKVRSGKADHNVARWADRVDAAELFVSAITIQELEIGILLAESMRYLTAGAWWLAVLPGLCLLVVVKLVDTIGSSTRALLDPRSHHL